MVMVHKPYWFQILMRPMMKNQLTQEGVDDDNKPTIPQDGSVSHDPAILAVGKLPRVLQTMYPSEWSNEL